MLLIILRSPTSILFPYTTLFRSWTTTWFRPTSNGGLLVAKGKDTVSRTLMVALALSIVFSVVVSTAAVIDRKSTRLNSSHVRISYAVVCMKKNGKVLLEGTLQSD